MNDLQKNIIPPNQMFHEVDGELPEKLKQLLDERLINHKKHKRITLTEFKKRVKEKYGF
jgi:hypothetical protein